MEWVGLPTNMRLTVGKFREQYGTRLAMYGGIDKHVIRRTPAEIVAVVADAQREALDRITYENAGAVLETARDMMRADPPGLEV